MIRLVMRYLRLARVYASLSIRAAGPLGAPLFLGMFVVAFIAFGPTGMRAADLVFTLRKSPPLALALWMGWLVLAFPVARLSLVPPSSLYLRWLPAPRAVLYASAAACALVVELPWMILFGRAEGIVSGLTAGLGAVALHAAVMTRPMGMVHVMSAFGWAISAFYPSVIVALVSACFAAVIAVKLAIDRAPEVVAKARGAMRSRAPEIALAMAHLSYLFRKEPAVLGRSFVLSILAGLSFPLAARGHDLETPSQLGALALGLAALAISLAMSGIAAAVIRSERLLAWLCDASGTSVQARVAASVLAVSAMGAASGVFLGGIAACMMRPSAWTLARIVMIPTLLGFAVGGVFPGIAREAEASPRRGDRGMVSTLLVMAFGIVPVSLWGERALGLHLVLAAIFVGMSLRHAEALRCRRGTS